jgi:hypothetical protein
LIGRLDAGSPLGNRDSFAYRGGDVAYKTNGCGHIIDLYCGEAVHIGSISGINVGTGRRPDLIGRHLANEIAVRPVDSLRGHGHLSEANPGNTRRPALQREKPAETTFPHTDSVHN